MKTLGYYNGKYGELDEMSIPMNDRVCWFGDGVYDAGPARNGKIFAIDEHIDRFFNSAGLLDIVMPVTKPELKQLLQEMVDKMDDTELFVYYQVTRGTGIRNHAYTEGAGNLRLQGADQADYAAGHPFPALQHQDIESDSVLRCIGKGKEGGLSGDRVLSSGQPRHRVRAQQCVHS